MPGLNPRRPYVRDAGRTVLHHGSRSAVAPAQKPEAAKPVDVQALLVEEMGDALAHTIMQTVEPFLAHNAAVIAELQERLRLSAIEGDQARRQADRVFRSQEKRIEGLTAEIEAQQRHCDSLRAQLREQRHWEQIGESIVRAQRQLLAPGGKA